MPSPGFCHEAEPNCGGAEGGRPFEPLAGARPAEAHSLFQRKASPFSFTDILQFMSCFRGILSAWNRPRWQVADWPSGIRRTACARAIFCMA